MVMPKVGGFRVSNVAGFYYKTKYKTGKFFRIFNDNQFKRRCTFWFSYPNIVLSKYNGICCLTLLCYILQNIVMISVYYFRVIRGGSRTYATSKMELFVIIVNGLQSLTIITKCSILNVTAVLDPSLVIMMKFLNGSRYLLVFVCMINTMIFFNIREFDGTFLLRRNTLGKWICSTFPGHKNMYGFFSGKYVIESLPSVLESHFIHYGVI